jgi:excisionase family DNA binding protein
MTQNATLKIDSLEVGLILQKLQGIEDYIKAAHAPKTEYATPAQICKELHISRPKFDQLVKDGFIKVYRMGSQRKLIIKRSEINPALFNNSKAA